MRRLAALVIGLLVATAPALAANDPPYLKLAQELGTPHLAFSEGPADKSYLQLKFTPDGETAANWTKMTTVSIVKVPVKSDTGPTTRGVIRTLRDALKERKVHILVFDESPLSPATCYFSFEEEGQEQKGIVYSPAAGYVTTAQVGAQNGGTITDADVKTLKAIFAAAH